MINAFSNLIQKIKPYFWIMLEALLILLVVWHCVKLSVSPAYRCTGAGQFIYPVWKVGIWFRQSVTNNEIQTSNFVPLLMLTFLKVFHQEGHLLLTIKTSLMKTPNMSSSLGEQTSSWCQCAREKDFKERQELFHQSNTKEVQNRP